MIWSIQGICTTVAKYSYSFWVICSVLVIHALAWNNEFEDETWLIQATTNCPIDLELAICIDRIEQKRNKRKGWHIWRTGLHEPTPNMAGNFFPSLLLLFVFHFRPLDYSQVACFVAKECTNWRSPLLRRYYLSIYPPKKKILINYRSRKNIFFLHVNIDIVHSRYMQDGRWHEEDSYKSSNKCIHLNDSSAYCRISHKPNHNRKNVLFRDLIND